MPRKPLRKPKKEKIITLFAKQKPHKNSETLAATT
jgi:hypothetical protein